MASRTTTLVGKAFPQAEEALARVGEAAQARRLAALGKIWDADEIRVAVFGEFNRGKSTLINALLGQVVLPAKLVPTTGHVTRLIGGPRDEVRVYFRDGRSEAHPLKNLDSFSSLDRACRAREDVERIEVRSSAPLLRGGLVLLDTPGINERADQTARAEEAIAESDLVLMVLDARQILSSGERSRAADWLIGTLAKPVVFVVNFLNLVNESERADVLKVVQAWARPHGKGELGRRVFVVNALGALKHVALGGPAVDDDFDAFRQALGDVVGARRRAVCMKARAGQLRAEVRAARARNDDVLGRLRDDAARLRAERDKDLKALRDRLRRFDSDAQSHSGLAADTAVLALDAAFGRLRINLAGESRASLEAGATLWFTNRLKEAITEIENDAEKGLSKLAGRGLPRPQPLTVGESMTLMARIEVGTLAAIPASAGSVGWATFIGGGIGTFLIPLPGVGTGLGAMIGNGLARWLGTSEPDYSAAYGEAAQKLWKEASENVFKLVTNQFRVRVQSLRQVIDERIAALKPVDGQNGELQSRQALASALDRLSALADEHA